MGKIDELYSNLLKDIIDNGVHKSDRTGTGTISVFGRSFRVNLNEGFPLLTTKKMYYKGIIHELLWFLQGNTNIKYLVENNTHIWDDDAYRFYKEKVKLNNALFDFVNKKAINKNSEIFNYCKNIEYIDEVSFIERVKTNDTAYLLNEVIVSVDGELSMIDSISSINENIKDFDIFSYSFESYQYGDLGPVYGSQWRSFGENCVDQIQMIIDTLKNNPDSRRILLTGYNPSVLNKVALPPCHMMAQFYTKVLTNGKRELSCMFYCRSQDVPLGTPFNIASYALLTHILANICDMEVGELIYFGGDCHIYLNQLESISEQILRDPNRFKSPVLKIKRKFDNISDISFNDIEITDYESYDKIKIPLSVGL